ncbi:hypothetical protein BC833DRAFT_623472 [Globomyces pollinis-pini]|nr:hypothetical protein BC833DRAFT_623472 [Globomyces pollinis-pini]
MFGEISSFIYKKPVIAISMAMGIGGPLMLATVYPSLREKRARPPMEPLSYPLVIRERTHPAGYDD